MPCIRCAEKLEAAAHQLQQLVAIRPDLLEPGTDWEELAASLIRVAGRVRVDYRDNGRTAK